MCVFCVCVCVCVCVVLCVSVCVLCVCVVCVLTVCVYVCCVGGSREHVYEVRICGMTGQVYILLWLPRCFISTSK